MSTLTESAIIDALRQVQEPELGRDIVTLKMVKAIAIDGTDVAFTIELTTPACPLKDEIEGNARSVLGGLGATRSTITWGAMVRRAHAAPGRAAPPGRQERHRRRVRQGRRRQEHRQRQPRRRARPGRARRSASSTRTSPGRTSRMMLGVEGQPKASANNKITPLERYGVKCISIQFFVPEGQPIVWRGPLVGGAIQQFLRDVDWGELDYLVIDLPPGTSDAQLTLAQAVPLGGAVLVTTPQEVALRDVGKALAMFKRHERPDPRPRREHDRLRLPALRRADRDLRPGRRRALRAEHGIDFLGGVPLDVTVRQGGDVGVPAVAQREPGPAARALTAVAGAVAARMSVRAAAADQQPLLSIS